MKGAESVNTYADRKPAANRIMRILVIHGK